MTQPTIFLIINGYFSFCLNSYFPKLYSILHLQEEAPVFGPLQSTLRKYFPPQSQILHKPKSLFLLVTRFHVCERGPNLLLSFQ